MSVVIAGSVALDNVKTPQDEQKNLLGGSASYAALAASIFVKPCISWASSATTSRRSIWRC
jgi:hypothetical protein